jgi:hypothetical protein
MELTVTSTHSSDRTTKSDRRIPGWAAGILTRLARDRPPVVTYRDVAAVLDDAGLQRDVQSTVHELQRLGWLAPVHIKGAWAYMPPGEDQVTDPYIDLRAWRERDQDAVFALAGESAAWHLGYLDRPQTRPTAVWVPEGTRLPHGIRPHVTVVTLGWREEDARRLGPAPQFLHRRRLDMTSWASGMPAFGVEALIVQLSRRPASFHGWVDLIDHLDQLAMNCEISRLIGLLKGQSASSWQRAAYILERGDQHDAGAEVLRQRPSASPPKVQFGNGERSVWVPEFHVLDRLILPLQQIAGKA